MEEEPIFMQDEDSTSELVTERVPLSTEFSDADVSMQPVSIDNNGLLNDHTSLKSIQEFLRQHTCYELLPISSKVIVFDTSLLGKKAFQALQQNEMRSAPLWNSEAGRFVGMLTVTDFIKILYQYIKSSPQKLDQMGEEQISSWYSSKNIPLLQCSPMEDLLRAASLLIDHRIHRLPLIDKNEATGTEFVVSVITQFRILKFIAVNYKERPDLLRKSLKELGLGTFGINNGSLAVIKKTELVIDILRIFLDRRISSLPVVDDNGVVLNVFEKYDILNILSRSAVYQDDGSSSSSNASVVGSYFGDLSVTVEDALKLRSPDFEGVHTCRTTDTLYSIFDTIRHATVHRFVIVDDKNVLQGVLSLSDLLRFLITTP